jgi:hypothetical protein
MRSTAPSIKVWFRSDRKLRIYFVLSFLASLNRIQTGFEMEHLHEIRVKGVGLDESPLSRLASILRERIQERCGARVVEGESDAHLLLEVSADLPPEAFRIDETGARVRIAGGSARGILYGIGKFLRTSRYEGGFTPGSWRGTSAPQGALRGMYFASHFHNWYHEAPEAELARYVDDIALWGVNAVSVCFPFIDMRDWEDPEAEEAVAMLRKHARIVKDAGLMFGLMSSNTFFSGVPQQLRAAPLPDPTGRRGNSGFPVCPSQPEGLAFILENSRRLFERVADTGVDFIVHWPYDEGGCACADCAPWGSNGYLKVSRALTRLGKEYFPGLKTALSTWMFDTPPEGEWQGLTGILAASNDWVDFILADAHEDFPRYPLESGVPGGLALINFPEISMWGNWPWGGAGANPLPGRFQRLWDQVKHLVSGGLPYSEGIYEDLNKAVVSQFYWDRERCAQATLEEYLAYELSPEVVSDALEMIRIFEMAASRFYQKQPVNPQEAERAALLAESIHVRLPSWARQNWRWELLRLRAVLDRERFAGGGLETPAAEAAMLRLVELYHCQLETDDPYHHRVRPPLKRAISRRGEH